MVSGAAGCGYLTVTQEKQVGSNPTGTAKINVPLDKLDKSPSFQDGDYGIVPRTEYKYGFIMKLVIILP